MDKRAVKDLATEADGTEHLPCEVRSFTAEVRSEEGKPTTIVGMPMRFDSLSADLGGFRERLDPGAVELEDKLYADFNHSPDYVLGKRSNGTLRMTKTDAGYQMEVEPPNTTWARDLIESICRGDIDGGSFAFRVKPGGQRWVKENGETVRVLTGIKVRAVSVVTNPAYPSTSGSFQVRSIDEILADQPNSESRTAGPTVPPADSRGGVEIDLLRRKLDLAYQQYI